MEAHPRGGVHGQRGYPAGGPQPLSVAPSRCLSSFPQAQEPQPRVGAGSGVTVSLATGPRER